MNRKPYSMAYNRDVSMRKALRKKRISDAWRLPHDWPPYYDNLHQFSKNKIHCSCGMCARYSKTKNKGKHRNIHGNYAPSYNPSMRDRRRIASMDDDEKSSLF